MMIVIRCFINDFIDAMGFTNLIPTEFKHNTECGPMINLSFLSNIKERIC